MSTLTNEMPVAGEDMFNGPFGKMVEEIDKYTEGSKVGVLVTFIGAFSAAVGGLPGVGTGKGSMPLSFWPVLVGPTGVGRKGTATGIAMKVVESGLGSFFQNNVSYNLPATGLGFANELAERAIRGVSAPMLFISEEMDEFIANAKRDTKIGGYLRKAWDGSTIGHRTSQVDLQIHKPHVAIVGHVQPMNWGAISGSRDATGGTYNRFFPVWVIQSKKLPVFSSANPDKVIERLGNRFRSMVNFAQEVTDLSVPKDVAKVFEAKHREICDAMTNGNEALGQYTERAMAYMIRLAGLYALADKRTEITVADFDAALALVTYMVETVTYTLPETSASGDDIPARILAFIQEAGPEGVTSTEVARKFQKVRAAEIRAITDACDSVFTSKLRSEGGRPATLFTWVEEPEEVVTESAVAVELDQLVAA
ncbi:DUF3987 domain-containing protein [Streptosporangium sp. G12]